MCHHMRPSHFLFSLPLWLLIVVCGPVSAAPTFSLLTADPGKQVWSQYGHTGIRYQDPEKGVDVVFNYGLFDFSSPNFISRFVKGQTDYMVGTTSFYNFMLEYQLENRGVTEQVLNLAPMEKDRLLQALLTNLEPENRTYRYNFFFKNCATLPRDLIEQAVIGSVSYSMDAPFESLRDVVHFFTENTPWTQFGIDLALGAPADKKTRLREQQFAPVVLMSSFESAYIETNSNTRPLVVSTEELVSGASQEETRSIPLFHPLVVCWMVFALTLLLTLLQVFKPANRVLGGLGHIYDGILYSIGGVVGSVMYFLLFASEHPTVNVNYLAVWLHPIHLLFALALVLRPFRVKSASLYKAINLPFCLLALGGLLYFPQALNPAMIPVLLAFTLRSAQGALVIFNTCRHA